MRVTYWLLTFFVASIAWAEPRVPLAFYAKSGDTLEPLRGRMFEIFSTKVSVLGYMRSSDPIPEFYLKDGYVITYKASTPEYVGFFKNLLVFGRGVQEKCLIFNKQMKVLNYPFYFCNSTHDTVHGITYSVDLMPYCSDVEIYLLPYDRKTGLPMTDVPITEEGGKKSPDCRAIYAPMAREKYMPPSKEKRTNEAARQGLPNQEGDVRRASSEIPMAFFAKVRRTLIPLYGHVFYEFSTERSVLSYGGAPVVPTKFTLKHGYAMATGTSTPGYVGLIQDGLFFGRTIPRVEITLDEDMTVQNSKFYSCNSIHSPVRVITTKHDFDGCFEVKLYLLPYSKISKYGGKYVFRSQTDFSYHDFI